MSGKNAIPAPMPVLSGDMANAASASCMEVQRVTAGGGLAGEVQFIPAAPVGHPIDPDLSTMKNRSTGAISPTYGTARHTPPSRSMITFPPAPPAPLLASAEPLPPKGPPPPIP